MSEAHATARAVEVAPPRLEAAPQVEHGGYVVGPVYDAVFFIYAPLLALALGLLVFRSEFFTQRVHLESLRANFSPKLILLFGAMFTKAHLVIVFFRSHGKSSIYRLHPVRFRVVPIALFVAMLTSKWIFVSVAFLAVWWDVYHSSLQTFGLARIYDQRRGNPPVMARRFDMIFNLALYIGPLVAGLSLMRHLTNSFQEFNIVNSAFFTSIPAKVMTHGGPIRFVAAAVSLAITLAYVGYIWALARRGYRMPRQKILLLVSTAICSIGAWGLMAPVEAMFVVNFFHALQYFGIVWWSEGKNLSQLFRLDRLPFSKAWGIFLLVVPAFVFAFWAVVAPGELGNAIVAVGLVVSIMHFWYDGFIWSVQKKQV